MLLAVLFLVQQTFAKIVLINYDIKYNAKYCTLNMSIATNNDGDSLLNITHEAIVPIEKLSLTFTLQFPMDDKDKDYQIKFLKSTIDVCKITRGTMGNFIVKMLMDEFYKSADFKVACPFPKVTTFKVEAVDCLFPILGCLQSHQYQS